LKNANRFKAVNDSTSPFLYISREVSNVRRALSEAGYTESSILQLFDVQELPPHRQRWRHLPLYAVRDAAMSPLRLFVQLFLFRETIRVADIRNIIQPTLLEDWVDVGLLYLDGSNVRAAVELCPYGSLILAADWPNEAAPNVNEIMGVAASSRTLAQGMVRRHSRATLDLGTGCGVLSLLSAAYSEHVVAVDSNPRALQMTQFNAQLNGVSNIECVEGNLFEPVHGRQFDLIVCNPPFVIAPEQIYLHSHSGMRLDGLCETIVRTAPVFMREGGYCQLLCNWAQLVGVDWRSRLASWFDGSGCDAWVLYSHSEDAADYAFHRISNLASSQERMKELFRSWTNYYEKESVEAVGFGLITMRRSRRMSHWFRCEAWPEMIGTCGDAVERGFAARDFLADHDDDQLLATRMRHASNIRWRQDRDLSNLMYSVHSGLHLTSGLAYSANAEPAVVEFVSRCNGDRPLSTYLKETAASSGQDMNQFAPRFLKLVRRFVEMGFLIPVL
jgi:hypothetical protein